jgi:hypothetical protein
MLIEAVYDKGQIRFLRAVELAHDRFKIKVDIPDSEILSQTSLAQAAETETASTEQPPAEYLAFMRLQQEAFGKDYVHVPEETDQDIMHEQWMKKHG